MRDLWTTNACVPDSRRRNIQPTATRHDRRRLGGRAPSRQRGFEVRYRQEIGREEDNQDVGFFVKNLENVQGDERDVMVFSTTFVATAMAAFIDALVLLERRAASDALNVAVTRAKQQVIVVGSMPIEEISTALSADLAPGSQLTPAGYSFNSISRTPNPCLTATASGSARFPIVLGREAACDDDRRPGVAV